MCAHYYLGKLPTQVDDDDAQQLFTTIANKLPQLEEETTNFSTLDGQDDSAPPLPPKPLAG